MRTAARDTEVEGVFVPAGSFVAVNIGSANHDEKVWENPEEFDIFRPPRQHLAFAWGPHMCLGLHLARMETRVVITQLLDRLPGLRFDPDAEPAAITGAIFRAPAALARHLGLTDAWRATCSATELEPCSFDPLTGFMRDGCCDAHGEDVGVHLVCVEMTDGVPRVLASSTATTSSRRCRSTGSRA